MYVRKTVLVLLLVVALLVGGAAAMFAGRMGVNSNYTLTKEEYENWQYMQSTYGKTDMLKKMMESSYYVPVDADKESMLAAAKENETVQAAIAGMTVIKEIAVPKKLVNLVVKPK